LVTKRDLSDISRLAGLASDYWGNVYMEIPLVVFNNDEVDEYFSRLAVRQIVSRAISSDKFLAKRSIRLRHLT
jgi:hypothetical protein